MPLTWSAWTPEVGIGVLFVGALYAAVVFGRGRDFFPGAEPATLRQGLTFAGGLLALYLALGSPLGVLAMGELFTAHMIQHMLAAIAAPPLLIAGTPAWLWRGILRPRWARALFHGLTRPVVALVLFNAVFGFMVWPPLIVAMVRSMPLMLALHLLLTLTGVLAWWPLVSPLPEEPPLHPAVQILYLIANGVPMILPLALVMLSTAPLYAAAYGGATRLFGLSLMSDQQLGAAICLTAVHSVYGCMLLDRFRRWAKVGEGEDEELRFRVFTSGRPQAAPTRPLLRRRFGVGGGVALRRPVLEAGVGAEAGERPALLLGGEGEEG